MSPKNDALSAGTLQPGSNDPPSASAPVGADSMGKRLADLAARLPDASTGGATVGAPVAAEPRPLSPLSKRVLGRWGALPLKAVQVALGWGVDTAGEDAEILGECTLDLVGTSDFAIDPATEARARWVVAHGLALGEGLLVAWERKVDAARKKAAADVQP